MKNVNTLIIDRDERFRNLLSELITAQEGTSLTDSLDISNEGVAASDIGEMKPDVMLLGIDRISSDEMRLFEEVRKEHPFLPVIVLPPHTREGADIALATLKQGAVEYIVKTMNRTGAIQTRDHFKERLLPVIKAIPRLNKSVLGNAKPVEKAVSEIEQVSSEYFDRPVHPMQMLVIVGCLGGVPALYLLLASLPDNLPVPVVVVQHMPKIFTETLAEDLRRITGRDVREATDGSELHPGRIYIAPGGYHAKVQNGKDRNTITLDHGSKIHGFRPSMDILLKSVRTVYGKRVLVAYLSGGGKDGVEGAEAIDIAGGQIIVQNKSTSLLWDLPLKIDILGIDEGRYPVGRLGHEISRRLN